MDFITFFHRNPKAGFSINKVTQTVISGFESKEEFYLPYFGGSVSVVIKNIFFTWKNKNRAAINHMTGDAQYVVLALMGCKCVLTVHDTVSLAFNKMGRIKKLLFEWLWYRLPLRFATKVVCISEETRKCVEKYTSRRDLVVIHNAIDPLFEKQEKDLSAKPKNVLLIGTNPNKNIERTIEALKDFDCVVTIIGKLSESQINVLKECRITYYNKSGLTDQQMVEEYGKSDLVSFISLFEGFGMIVIEANKVGRPVICSDIPVLKEVAGEAALFVNPHDVEDMKKGFDRLFNDAQLRKDLVEKGYANIERFTVDNIRKEWIQLYNSI